MKKRILTLTFVILVALLAAMTVQASTPQELYLEKTCSAETYCDIHDAHGPFEILNGGRIYYYDHNYFENPAGISKETAKIEIISADGKHSLIGNVTWVWREEFKARYIIYAGTGDLVGMHASGNVNLLSSDTWTFSLTGIYHIEP
jgi:hypothetical protein